MQKVQNKTQLAQLFTKSRRTIQRELARGWVTLTDTELREYETYSADLAQNKADEAKRDKGPGEKIGHDHTLAEVRLANHAIRDKIKEDKYSPYAIVAKYEAEGWPSQTRLCGKTIYRYVEKGIIEDTSEKDLLRKGKRPKKRKKLVAHSRAGALERSIDKRPEYINDRSEAGHWEIDTVRGPQGGSTACLLTMTERKYRAELIFKLPDGKAESVKAKIDELERKLGDQFYPIFKSITPDNGSEFSDFIGLERS